MSGRRMRVVISEWIARMTCRTYGHAARLRGFEIDCSRCLTVISPDPRNAQWHYTDAPYICGAPNGEALGCLAWVSSPDGTCTKHA